MQLTITKGLLIFCFLQTLKLDALVWAKDAEPASSVEQTTQFNSIEEGITGKPNSLENTDSSETIDEQITTTTTANIESCETDKSTECLDTCNCKCGNEEQPSGESSAEETTTSTSVEETTTATSAEETTTATIAEEGTSTPNDESTEETTTAPAISIKPDSTTSANSNESTEKPTPTFTCENAGSFAHPTDCRRYFNCYPIVGTTNYEAMENVCPTGQAFSSEFSSCMRDLSLCSPEQGGFECLTAGSFPDPQSNETSYYRCVPRLSVGDPTAPTFHVFHINCGVGKIFIPQLGKCFIDLNAPQTGLNSPDLNAMPDDEQLVKAELKQWKVKEKLKVKEEKLKLKYEKKLEKELAKKASKEAKEKAKKEEKAKKGKSLFDDDYD